MEIGSSHIKIINKEDNIREFLNQLNLLEKDHIIIKPNWVDPNIGTHTDAKILDLIISQLKCKVTLIESYTTWRNNKYLKGFGWPKQPIKPENGSLNNIRTNIDWIREQDKWFLNYTKISDVLKKYNVEYINVTEEILKNRATNPEHPRSRVHQT